MIPVEQLYQDSVLKGTPKVQSKAARTFYSEVNESGSEIRYRICMYCRGYIKVVICNNGF